MTYEYGSESKRLELPNPYRLQNRLLWLCAVLLVTAGVVSLLWARSAMNHAEPMLNSRTMPRGYGSKNEEPNLANAPPTDGLRRGADPLGDIWSRLVHQLPEQ